MARTQNENQASPDRAGWRVRRLELGILAIGLVASLGLAWLVTDWEQRRWAAAARERVDHPVEGVLEGLPYQDVDLAVRDARPEDGDGTLQVTAPRTAEDDEPLDPAALALDPRRNEAAYDAAGRTLLLQDAPAAPLLPAGAAPLASLLLGLAITAALTTLAWHRRDATRWLRSSEERLETELALRRHQQIVETSSEMLFFVDPDLRFRVVNPAYAALYSTTPEGLQGRRVEDVVGPDIWARIRPLLEIVGGGASHTMTSQGRDRTGQVRWIETTLRPFVQDGEVQGVVGSLHDVTEARLAQAELEAERAHLEERVAARTAELQGSESKLRAERQRLEDVIAGTRAGTWEWRVQTGELVVNDRWAEIVGYRRDELRPISIDTWLGLAHPEDLQDVEDRLRAHFEGRAPYYEHEARMRHKGGHWVWVADRGKVVARSPDGSPTLMSGTHQDITERKAAEAALRESEARARAIIDASPVPFALNESPERLTYLNPAFTRTFGYRLEDIPTLAHWWPMAYPDPEYRQWVEGAWTDRLEQSALTGEPFVPLEVRIRTRGGQTLTVLASAVELGRSFAGLHLVSFYDVTELKEAREQAEAAARGQAAFLAHMSHEIRTPMNGILGLAEIALHRDLTPDARTDLEQIHESASALLGILNDILDYSRIESGRLRIESALFDREDLLAILRGFFAHAAVSKGLGFRVDVDPSVPRYLLGDALRLQQILSNLVANAIKFTDEGEIRLRLTDLAPGETPIRLRWSVTDTGIGMDATAMARVLQPFAQGDDSIARRFGGTGLGLSISQDLLRLMGSELQIESTPGAGSTFSFELVLNPTDHPVESDAAPAAPSADLAGLRLLVAEDQPTNQRVIGDMLHLLRIPFVLARDGEEALAQLAKSRFDAVLMDIQMPRMDGLTATRRIRANPAWSALPVIALTAGVTPAERARMTESGMSDLLAKPITLDSLIAALGRWLGTPIEAPARPSGAPTADRLVLPGFDLAPLLEIETPPRVCQLLRQFAELNRAAVDAIADALASDAKIPALEAAHRIKGAAATVGARDLRDAAAGLEVLLQEGRDTGPGLARLRAAQEAALSAIAGLPSAEAEVVGARADPREAHRLAAEIQSLVAAGLLVPAERLTALASALPADRHALYQDLSYHLDRFDYRAAHHCLAELLAGDT